MKDNENKKAAVRRAFAKMCKDYLDKHRRVKTDSTMAIRLPKKLLADLKKEASKENVTLSEYIRVLLVCRNQT